MRILVVGGGAIGGWIAGTLAKAGADVSLLARGATLDALRAGGLTIRDGDDVRIHRIAASDRVGDLPEPDVVALTVKTQDFSAAVAQIAPILRRGVAVVTAMNGLPWWFLDGLKGSLDGARIERLDPQGRAGALLQDVAPIAAVVHATTRAEAPGVVRVIKADRLILGEPDGGVSDATREFAELIEAGGCAAPISPAIRADIWSKLWGNMSMNPISALTRLTSSPILDDQHVSRVLRAMMEEFAATGEKLGLPLPTVDERMDVARKLGDFRTSMLNDAESGKPLELDGLLGVVIEIADRLGVDVPTSRTVYALAHGLDLRR